VSFSCCNTVLWDCRSGFSLCHIFALQEIWKLITSSTSRQFQGREIRGAHIRRGRETWAWEFNCTISVCAWKGLSSRILFPSLFIHINFIHYYPTSLVASSPTPDLQCPDWLYPTASFLKLLSRQSYRARPDKKRQYELVRTIGYLLIYH
jgi:hypothetical protein